MLPEDVFVELRLLQLADFDCSSTVQPPVTDWLASPPQQLAPCESVGFVLGRAMVLPLQLSPAKCCLHLEMMNGCE